MTAKKAAPKTAKPAPARINWQAIATRNAAELIGTQDELSSVRMVLSRFEADAPRMRRHLDIMTEANARARIHWENRSAWFYFVRAIRALFGKPNNTNGINI